MKRMRKIVPEIEAYPSLECAVSELADNVAIGLEDLPSLFSEM